MQKIVLTGNIGSGKSTIAQIFQKNEIPFLSADSVIHTIYEKNIEFKQFIEKVNPNLIDNHKVSKSKISAYLQENPDFLSKLEAVLYPILHLYRQEFIMSHQDKMHILFEVPLLFEKNLQDFYDVIILTYAPYDIRQERALKRQNMTQEKFDLLNKQQIPYQEILDKVDIAIDTTHSLQECEAIITNRFFKI